MGNSTSAPIILVLNLQWHKQHFPLKVAPPSVKAPLLDKPPLVTCLGDQGRFTALLWLLYHYFSAVYGCSSFSNVITAGEVKV